MSIPVLPTVPIKLKSPGQHSEDFCWATDLLGALTSSPYGQPKLPANRHRTSLTHQAVLPPHTTQGLWDMRCLEKDLRVAAKPLLQENTGSESSMNISHLPLLTFSVFISFNLKKKKKVPTHSFVSHTSLPQGATIQALPLCNPSSLLDTAKD